MTGARYGRRRCPHLRSPDKGGSTVLGNHIKLDTYVNADMHHAADMRETVRFVNQNGLSVGGYRKKQFDKKTAVN